MKKFLFAIAGLLLLTSTLYAQNFNLIFRSNLTYGVSLANIGGYVDSLGNEYALVGYYDGLSIVDVTDPDNPVIKFTINGPQSDWREVKTWQQYAYVTTEGGSSGLQIVDLSDLPNSVNSKYWTGTGAINGQLETIHALHIEDAHVYLFGSNLFSGAALIVDLADPWNPVYMGHTSPNVYVHDGYVRADKLYAGHVYAGYFAVYDVTNKAAPVLLAQQTTPGEFTHNTWLNDSSTVLLTTDEVSASFLTAYDITDLSDIKELDRFQTTPGSGSIVHNTHVLNDYAVTSWYKDGVSICDVSRPDNIVEVARYDTYPQGTGSGFSGCWGVYPYLPSGNIVASDINNGLYVLTPTYIKACFLEGVVTDSVTGLPLNNAVVDVAALSLSDTTTLLGIYKTGTVTPGTVSVEVSRPGYATKTINNVILVNGQVTIVDVALSPISAFTAAGQVLNANTLQPVSGAQVHLFNSTTDEVTVADVNGNFSIPAFFPDNYSVDAGMWGYRTYCADNVQIDPSTVPLTIYLQPGIYDDFVFDLGWTVTGASSNEWERGEPIGTTTGPGGNTPANPNFDVNNDCRDKAYVTDNGGGGPWDNDVDGGNTILTSPVFDVSLMLNPYVNYYRWFHNSGNNGGGSADDTLTVKLTNGVTTVTLESVYPNTPQNSSWQSRSYQISQYLTPTANMQIIIETADWGPVFNIVEGGFDKFEVTEGPVGVAEPLSPSVSVFPNPSSESFTLLFNTEDFGNEAVLLVTDLTGRVVYSVSVKHDNGQIEFGSTLSAGIYSLQIVSPEKNSIPVVVSKVR